MNKLNLTSKMLLWALFPIVCFAIAIAATKWYCDTVTPRELIQSNTPLNWNNTSFEKLPAELKTQINPNRELRYKIADASYSFPKLKKKIAKENNSKFKAYLFNIYIKDDNSWERESQWIYYNNGTWTLESVPLTPDFEATIFNLVWFLSFGICLIASIISKIYNINNPHIITSCCLLLVFPFLGWLISDRAIITIGPFFSYGNIPEWTIIALIICEIAIISLIYQIYAPKLKQLLDTSNSNKETELGKYLSIKNLTTSRFIQVVENNEEKERLEIIFFDEYLLIGENNKWDKFSYNINDDNSIITIIDNDNNYNIIKVNKGWDVFPQLTFNGLNFTKDGKSVAEWRESKQMVNIENFKQQLRNKIISSYSKRNFAQKIWHFISRKPSSKERESMIIQIFDETFEEVARNNDFSINSQQKIEKEVIKAIKTKIKKLGN